jgi:hypothetical protein
MSDDFHLSDEERTRLERLKRDLVPPSRTEADLIEMLRRRGLVRDPRTGWVTPAILATAVAVGLVAALFVYRQIADSNPVNQPEFVLLLYAGDEAGATPSRRDEYSAWARSIAAQGTTISSLELAEPAELIAVLPDNPGSGPPAQPRGLFVVRARDLAEAQRIAATCPHLRYGGQIVLRRAVS